ncbi:MAG TPA: hypothetical protein VF661_14790 [Actinomycetales bacterium]
MAYVAAVRRQLDDLGATEVEELTGGLEADLADLAAESDDPLAQRLGPPHAYADELRAAAGLPARGQVGRTSVAENVRENWDDLLQRARSHPRGPAVESFLRTLQPAWWVLRAVIAMWALVVVLGTSGSLILLVLLLAFVVVSVELGRGRWSGRRGLAPLVVAGNALAAVLLLPFLVTATSFGANGGGADQDYQVYGSVASVPGLARDGQPVRNVFAFDAQGRPLTDVQLFDQDGRPLGIDPAAVESEYVDSAPNTPPVQRRLVPAVDVYGRQVWNVYPLRRAEVVLGDGSTGTPDITSPPTPVAPPLVAAPPVADVATAASSGTPTTSPTVVPTTSPTDVPTTSPTVAPTTSPTDAPTTSPTVAPTTSPTVAPTDVPTTARPTPPASALPTDRPTVRPTG